MPLRKRVGKLSRPLDNHLSVVCLKLHQALDIDCVLDCMFFEEIQFNSIILLGGEAWDLAFLLFHSIFIFGN